MILLPHLDSFTSADTFNSRQVFVAVCLTVGVAGRSYPILGSGTKLSVTAPHRLHVDADSSLLCVPPFMFPSLVQLTCNTQKKDDPEELPTKVGKQLELIHEEESSTYTCKCYIKNVSNNTVEAQTQQELPAPAASCPPEREPADLPALQPADLSFQSQCRVKLLCLLYTVLIVKSLVYCCGLSLLMMLTNKGASTNCTHAD
ncbi:uncharacterized protein LOC120718841 isoform X13 [Simochromis diagramma]|uniref:uncharacterized protein LOC120718841 isoform X13 n=1 Tax=Simochromis diagramma TaxID=43689 RepID=UPI001A7E94BD|nr:uncharacterized protein LOC120718841 isoform X13 [Simochromis diagramma]